MVDANAEGKMRIFKQNVAPKRPSGNCNPEWHGSRGRNPAIDVQTNREIVRTGRHSYLELGRRR